MSSTIDWSAFLEQLKRFVAARVHSPSDVDDLVQLILERAVTKAAGAELESVAGWLFGIARNAVADHYRQQARALVSAAEDLERVSSPLGDSEEERAAVIACMEPLLETLAQDAAQLLRWADMEGRSMKSIADQLGIGLSAAKSRVQRARKDFVQATSDCCAITIDARGRVTDLTPRAFVDRNDCSCEPATTSTKNIRSHS
jgi:RNA polymerase sigma-70 factor, ECF subfamily